MKRQPNNANIPISEEKVNRGLEPRLAASTALSTAFHKYGGGSYRNVQQASRCLGVPPGRDWLAQQCLPKNPAHHGTSKLAVAPEYATVFTKWCTKVVKERACRDVHDPKE
jgi:hypothetical protein